MGPLRRVRLSALRALDPHRREDSKLFAYFLETNEEFEPIFL